MTRSSEEAADRNRSFIGFYIEPAVKKKVERRAKREGLSLSEWMRRQLQNLDEAAEQTAATA